MDLVEINVVGAKPFQAVIDFSQSSEDMSDDELLRVDARANRDRILDVARDALATDQAASLNSIAKSAGVGAGTLYRHFPSRESLVLSVYRKEIDTLVALAPHYLPNTRHSRLFTSGATDWLNSGG
jgi:AcrR family transcriptional regulator